MTGRRLRRALATWAVLWVALACGHYGPPERLEPSPAGTDTALPDPDEQDDRDEP